MLLQHLQEFENTHADHKADDDHGEVEEPKLLFACHEVEDKNFGCL